MDAAMQRFQSSPIVARAQRLKQLLEPQVEQSQPASSQDQSILSNLNEQITQDTDLGPFDVWRNWDLWEKWDSWDSKLSL